MNVGFIGLGIMGGPMATQLVKNGFNVFVYDLLPDHVKELEAIGATGCKSYKEMAENCSVVITMLPNWPHVEAALLGEDGIAAHIAKGSLIIDCSSVAPDASRRICGKLNEMGLRMLDAPVSGGHGGAVAGTLSIMVGGSEEDYLEAKPLFDAMGNGGLLIGDIGAGNVCKLANQIMVAANLAGGAEALTLAKRAGVDVNVVWDAIKDGFAGNNSMNARAVKMLTGDFTASFAVDIHWKDLNNVLDTGFACGAPTPITLQVQNMFNYLRAGGDGKCDHSALYKYYSEFSKSDAE